jgi:glutamyl-Q tRNA(Asp) synthetase
MATTQNYVGRFAPSPTGPLHFGSLVAALASYLDARYHGGSWLLRIEDLDPPRESPQAPEQIMQQLKALGFVWDGTPLFQSKRLSRYQECLDTLWADNRVYLCTCSRKSFASVYPGRCRGQRHTNQPNAIRLQLPDQVLGFDDLVLGKQSFDLNKDIGDFILRRKDGLFAYQIAVVVDDHDQGITHIIRGSDLLDSTPRQICLGQYLNFAIPKFGHVPVVVDASGQKLSKQAHARAIDLGEAAGALKQALKILQQPIPDQSEPQAILAEAIQNWSMDRIPRLLEVPAPSL